MTHGGGVGVGGGGEIGVSEDTRRPKFLTLNAEAYKKVSWTPEVSNTNQRVIGWVNRYLRYQDWESLKLPL